MITRSKGQLLGLCTAIFDALGSPHGESAWVAETLVRANLVGHDSHGVVRLPLYLGRIADGSLRPGSRFEVGHETPALAVVDGNLGWGQVTARKAMELAIRKAREAPVVTVIVRNCQHIGRVGEWPAMAAAADMIGLAIVNSRGGASPVAPWGGIDGRLETNPLAFAAPSGREWPIVVDLSTSVIPEGKVEQYHLAGLPAPEGSLIDSQGRPTRDPAVLRGSPRGAILPFGGVVGHKGYGLSIMADLIAGALSGAGVSGRPPSGPGNGVFFQVVNIADFMPVQQYVATVQQLAEWIKSSRKQEGVEEILLPGEPEFRTAQQRRRHGVPLPERVWEMLVGKAGEVGVTDFEAG